MSANDPYYLNLLINIALLVAGVAAGYFTARSAGQQTAIKLKNELINSLIKKVELLEQKVKQLEEDKEKLQSTIDDLVAVEEARKRLTQKHSRPASPALKHSSVAKADAESENVK